MSVVITCTSDTRPNSPDNGDLLYETDTNKLLLYFDGWITYGQSNTSTGGETPTIVFSHGDMSLISTLSSESQTGDMLFDTSPGVNTLSVLTNTTSSIFTLQNIHSDDTVSRFTPTIKNRPTLQSIQHYISGGDQNITQLLSAGDITTTTVLSDLFYIYDQEFNTDRVVVFGKYDDVLSNDILVDDDIDLIVVDDTTTQQLSVNSLEHAFVSVKSADASTYVNGVYDTTRGGVFGVRDRELYNDVSYSLACSSVDDINLTGRYIYTTNFRENTTGAYTVDMWFSMAPSITGHINRQLMGYSSSTIRVVFDENGGRIESTGTYFGSWATESGVVDLDTWYRITATRDASGSCNVYLDGQLIATYTYSGLLYIREFAGDSSYSLQDNFMHGDVYSLGLWLRDLSQQEIDDLSTPDLTHRYSPSCWLFPSSEITRSDVVTKKAMSVTSSSKLTSINEHTNNPNANKILTTAEEFDNHVIYTNNTPF